MSTSPAPAANEANGQHPEVALSVPPAARVEKFELGNLFITPGARDALLALGINPARFILHHYRGEWGDLSEHDRDCNDVAVKDGGRIFSSYKVEGLPGGKVWVITEAEGDDGHRAATTILLPSEY